MKVLHVAPSYKPAFVYGGPTRSVANLCEELARSEVRVDVFCTNANGTVNLDVKTGEWKVIDGVRVMYFKRWIKDHVQLAPALVVNTFRRCRDYDKVHVHSWWNLTSVLGAWSCLIRGVVPVVSLRGTLSEFSFERGRTRSKSLLHRLIGKSLLKRCHLHVTSKKEMQDCYRILGDATITVVPNVVEMSKHYIERQQGGELRALFVGRIHPVKNLEMLFDAIEDSQCPKLRLSIVGDGDLDYVEKLKKRSLNLSNAVSWKGTVRGEDKHRLMAGSTVLILPSHTENFGNVAVEALLQGTPVIVTKNAGVSDFVSKYDLGWVIENRSLSLVHALQETSLNKDKINRIRRTARDIVETEMGPRRLIRQYLELYQKHESIPQTEGVKSLN